MTISKALNIAIDAMQRWKTELAHDITFYSTSGTLSDLTREATLKRDRLTEAIHTLTVLQRLIREKEV